MKFSELKCCPFCGCEEYYEKQYVRGTIEYISRFDGEEADNSELYEGLLYDCSGRVYCVDCGRYLGNIQTEKVGVEVKRKLGVRK